MSHQSSLISTDIEGYLAQHERKELLRLLTCGSVDDGKSTLIGRLLYDSKLIYEDQLDAVRKDSKKHGTTGDDFDPALLTDGLKAEREQGITIDVAYRYFSTAKRKFIIADTPGHEQYTRNMATGASTCDLAIILIDARHGVLTQTRRHSFIASLLGIRHVIVAINKMDLVGYEQATFDRIKGDYSEFASRLTLGDVDFIPLCALAGENVVHRSEKMPWYEGSTLMHMLENVHIASDRNLLDLRFPVQLVSRPSPDFRGFQGTVASGTVRPGDEVMVLPSRTRSRVKEIVTADGNLSEATPPFAVTLTLEDEVDVSRGDVIVRPNNEPLMTQYLEAMIVWMAEAPLEPGKTYRVKQLCQTTPGRVADVRYRMDINTLRKMDAETLHLNEIGRCTIELDRAIAFDSYRKNRATGAFVVIDRLTNDTVGAGMAIDRLPQSRLRSDRLAMPDGRKSKNIRVEAGSIQPAERHATLGQRPLTLWFTGLSGSGKSSIARAVERTLHEAGRATFSLDGDNVRFGLNRDLGFSKDDRKENIRRIAEVANLFNEAGLIVLVPVISPYREDRENARGVIGADRFVEIHVDTPLAVCEQRDVKGLYKRARTGEIPDFTGISAPYEAPESPELRLGTESRTIDECARQILDAIEERLKP